jgi:calcium-dependent protein kinase
MESIEKRWFIHENKGNIEEFYTMNTSKSLGEGASGSVFLAKHKTTKFNRAIKRIPKRHVKNQQRLVNEINILRTLDHPNIIRLFETFEDEKYLYLVM